MPVYEYKCNSCAMLTEAWQKISDSPLITCPHCSGELKKVISCTSFHLKGSGWYVTDYAGRKAANSDKEGASAKPSDKPSEKPSPQTTKE